MQQSTDLITDLSSSTQELRGSLIELLGDVGLDPRRAQTLGKKLRVDKSLAWKISNIVKSDEPGSAVRHLPGNAAFEIFLTAVRGAGANALNLKRVASAYEALQGVVEKHTGDRPTLELVMDSMPQRAGDRLNMSRKLAFRGNSGIWGVQAKTRVNTAIVAPSKDDSDMQDVANIGGWIDFRRLRADARWALFRVQVFDSSEPGHGPSCMAIDPNEPSTGPMLLRDFCSPSLPPIESTLDSNGDQVYELGRSSIGNAGAFTCFYGSKIPRIASRWASDENDRGEFAATISAPVESLQFDLLLHRDCEFATNPVTQVYGVLNFSPETRHDRDLIPVDLTRTELGGFPPVLDTPRVRGYGKMLDYVMSRCGWQREDFVGVRFSLDYPPFPSTVVLSFPLASR